jgi:hypothetical protein
MTKRPISRSNSKTALLQIARKLTALEKDDVKSAIEKGRLLQEACDQCEDGTYTKWLKGIGWSERTAMRHRDIYALAQTNRQIAGLFVDVSTLYVLVDKNLTEVERKAIIKVALKRRVEHSDAIDIVQKLRIAAAEGEAQEDKALDKAQESEARDDEAYDYEAREVHEDAPPHELITAMNNVMLPYWVRTGEWPKVIGEIGSKAFLEFITMLQAVYADHGKAGAVKIAADRAEAKTAKVH